MATKAEAPCYKPSIVDLFDTHTVADEEAARLRRAGYPKVRIFQRHIDAGGARAVFHVVVVYPLRNGGEHVWTRKPYSSAVDVCKGCGATRKAPTS